MNTKKGIYTQHINLFLEDTMFNWLNEQVAKVKKEQGIYSQYNRSELVRGIIRDRMHDKDEGCSI